MNSTRFAISIFELGVLLIAYILDKNLFTYNQYLSRRTIKKPMKTMFKPTHIE
ncbi:hypothetical protein BTHERMOSOX_1749 [Bathymodiolus thermophilus thioautotrophic gill symbiont]|nr:hypothetical protein [Bathymodiolus thermophilus thioautotrophic gill symbiont]CAB5496056.1 hypothetical protein THERMOT_451 [Bathymodiolus thermophilus thioautotrophic gill symbiont]SGZ83727.1 hypothetical protein BTHERMOSOX_1749 [Bathymodiolus thermophilus thioautotrophic gill symbiont]